MLSGLLLLCLFSSPAIAANGFEITRASVTLKKEVYRVDALVNYTLTGKALEALENGVPLILELELQVLRKRPYLWNETMASVLLRHRLSYRALSRRYQVENLNTGKVDSFPSLKAALAFLHRVNNFPLIDRSLLQADRQYLLAIKATLDIESLPTPLRALAYVTPEWYLGSDWYTLPMKP